MSRTLKNPGEAHSPIIGWQERVSEAGNRWHQCRIGLAVVGDVFEIKHSHLPDAGDVGLFLWDARTMDDARSGNDAPRGYAPTLAAAKAIVECILHNTGTANDPKANENARLHADKAALVGVSELLESTLQDLLSARVVEVSEEFVNRRLMARQALQQARAALAAAKA